MILILKRFYVDKFFIHYDFCSYQMLTLFDLLGFKFSINHAQSILFLVSA
jgi:hypothetical protein